jgi:hypothetical protein
MSRKHHEAICPNCSKTIGMDYVAQEVPEFVYSLCPFCYYPLKGVPQENRAEIRIEPVKKIAFLIHSSKREEKYILDWFRYLVGFYGVKTQIIEEDHRSVDWLQKSLDGIKSSNFVLALLTRRYQYADEKGVISGWRAPDKCYDEIAISFALNKDLYALVEHSVDSGNVLNSRAWCYGFEKKTAFQKTESPIVADRDFFRVLDQHINP